MKKWQQMLINTYVRFVRSVLGVDQKKVLFTSFQGGSYSDNPKAVSEALHTVAPDLKIVWMFHNPESKKRIVPEYVRCVKYDNHFAAFKEIATAGVFVNNFTFRNIPKGKKQRFVQLWHGDKAFKKILHDSPDSPADRVLAEQLEGYCDLAVAGSDYGEMQFRSAFRYTGEVAMCGTPRNDRLVNPSDKECADIKKALGISENVKVFMYAPTLRWEQMKAKEKQTVPGLDVIALLNLLEARDGCKWKCILRAHPSMVGLTGVKTDERIMDLSGYDDMADLLLISDMLITDYSSCAGDFALLRRPIVLYQADRQEYLEKDRTLYFEMEDSPYFVAENQAEAEQILQDMTAEKAKENCEEILRFYGNTETGKASEQIARIIKDWVEKR